MLQTFLDQPQLLTSRATLSLRTIAKLPTCDELTDGTQLTHEIARESIAGTRTTRSVTIFIALNVSVF